MKRTMVNMFLIALLLILANACGGGGGSTPAPTASAPPQAQPTGTVDKNFNGGAVQTWDGGNDYNYASDVKLDGSGNIFVVGTTYNGSDDDVVLLKYKADGSLDSAFGSAGTGAVTWDGGGSTDNGRALTLDGSGNIYITGGTRVSGSYGQILVLKYTASGVLDDTFAASGVLRVSGSGTNGTDTGNAIAMDSTGKILVAGSYYSTGSNIDAVVFKLTSVGASVSDWGSSGSVIWGKAGVADIAYDIVVDADDNLYVCGSAGQTSANSLAFVRKYQADGTLDSGFATSGVFTKDVAGKGDRANGCALDADGKLVIAGVAEFDTTAGRADYLAMRLTTTGVPDKGFVDTNGLFTWDSGSGGNDDAAGRPVIDSLGNIYLAGSIPANSVDIGVLRLDSGGVVDTSFANSGLYTYDGGLTSADSDEAAAM